MVVVHDFQGKRTYETNTRNVCAERDFMRFEAEGRKPDWLEEEFGKLEAKACEAIGAVVRTRTFDGEHKNYILNLMAVLAVRSPEQRENMRDFQARVATGIMDLVLETREHWESENERMQEATGTMHNVTYEQAKKSTSAVTTRSMSRENITLQPRQNCSRRSCSSSASGGGLCTLQTEHTGSS